MCLGAGAPSWRNGGPDIVDQDFYRMGCGGSEEANEGKIETQEVAVVEEAPPEGWVQAPTPPLRLPLLALGPRRRTDSHGV